MTDEVLTGELVLFTLPDGRRAAAGDVIDWEGRPARVCRNGALKAVDNGYFLTPAAPEGHGLQPVRTSEDASKLAFMRWHKPRQDAVAAAVADFLHTGELTIADADAYLVKTLITDVILKPGVREDFKIKAWQAVLGEAGMSGRPQRGQPETELQTAEQRLGQAVLMGLVRRLEGGAE